MTSETRHAYISNAYATMVIAKHRPALGVQESLRDYSVEYVRMELSAGVLQLKN